MKSVIHLGISPSLETLTSCFLSEQPLVVNAKTASSVAIVFGPGSRQDFRNAVLNALQGSQLRTFDAAPGFNPSLFIGGLRRSKWTDVDVDSRAPRLRTVRLPNTLVSSQAIIGAADLRAMCSKRPLIALGLWAPLAGPVHRLGSLITGQREGLTAEVGLAIQPAALIVITSLGDSGPLTGIVSDDPIAIELIALAIWQSRLPSAIDRPGPWEDHLVQRATELGLGVTQPSQLVVETTYCHDLTTEAIDTAQKSLTLALSMIGVDHGGSGRE